MKESNQTIAVVTVSDEEYRRYINAQPVGYNFVKISVLKDIKRKEFNKVVLLNGSDNVANYVINKASSLTTAIEDLITITK